MKTLIGLAALFLSLNLLAEVPGLRSGTEFTSVSIRGSVSVQCMTPQGNSSAVFSCGDNILYPGDFDFFYHPDKVAGDKVTLRSEQANGRVRTASKNYDAQTGLSKTRFNLWISTLFQRPLLNFGVNKIDFEVTERGVITDIGAFEVVVNRSAEVQTCQRRHYFSSNLDDCRNGANICSRYFRELNYCQ